MNVQSLSIVVPGGCPNACKFCVSRMKADEYKDHIERNLRFRDLYERDYMDRLAFARDNGCNTAILTGDGEPLVNIDFLNDFASWNARLSSPFRWLEIQTSGVGLDEEKLRWLRNTIRVSTISLSLSSIFDNDENASYNGTPESKKIDIKRLTQEIKRYDFNLRISVNMTDFLDEIPTPAIFERLQKMGANMVTFRQLFAEGESEQAAWVREHGASEQTRKKIDDYILSHGSPLGILPTGLMRYSVHDMSIVHDGDCMARQQRGAIRYLILRPNCKLYTRWDDSGSILF
ncbi:radical SAM protein [Sediminispirochaeta bajacaliforniensis]|uniref:radical SAM protein n=1 Tax=Sediminispirochaeta bajacaliforniensis TaxID=148 RepID=UPI000381CD79|nr:radical SAM protein [Sediminispirochaeta bajacaliforniensis]